MPTKFSNATCEVVATEKLYMPLQLSVSWPYALAILAAIPFLQAVCLLAVVWYAGDVAVKDESYLSTAKLLRPIVERLGDRGCLLTGRRHR